MSSVSVKMLLYDLLLVHDGAVVADTLKGDEVAFGDVGGIELDASFTVGIRRNFRIPIERSAMVGARLLALVRVLRRKELYIRLPALLMNGGHTEWLASTPCVTWFQVH